MTSTFSLTTREGRLVNSSSDSYGLTYGMIARVSHTRRLRWRRASEPPCTVLFRLPLTVSVMTNLLCSLQTWLAGPLVSFAYPRTLTLRHCVDPCYQQLRFPKSLSIAMYPHMPFLGDPIERGQCRSLGIRFHALAPWPLRPAALPILRAYLLRHHLQHINGAAPAPDVAKYR